MSEHRLENLIVRIPGEIKESALEQAQETSRIAKDVSSEIERASKKCGEITEVDGNPADIFKLYMTGQTSIEKIAVSYKSEGKTRTRVYTKEKFYSL